jgi:hypothetical protein
MPINRQGLKRRQGDIAGSRGHVDNMKSMSFQTTSDQKVLTMLR